VGECAGDIVEPVDLLLASADERAEATAVAFHKSLSTEEIARRARDTFQIAAQALLTVDRAHDPNVESTSDRFRADWYDSGRIPEGVGHTFFAAFDEEIELMVRKSTLMTQDSCSLPSGYEGCSPFFE
ncbi:MAG: hypothetical protein ACPGQS_10930, partial [Bradymonadia bacterium]